MKIGCVGVLVPEHVKPAERPYYQIQKVADLGGQITGVMAWDLTPDERKRLREFADSKGIELECWVAGVFGLASGDPGRSDARADLEHSLDAALDLGGPVVHTGYGRLRKLSSRFNRDIPVPAHLARLAASLREAAKLAEERGQTIAVENHCDFSGKELAWVLRATESKAVGAALDTGNAYTVLCDPWEDALALAPLTVTTHLKDMKIVEFRDEIALTPEDDRVPFLPIGCALGEGNVDIMATVELLAKQCPRGWDLPLIVETGWLPNVAGKTRAELIEDVFRASLAYLRANLSAYLSA